LWANSPKHALLPLNAIRKYNATTGVAINASFITGLNFPIGLALPGNNLFVAINHGITIGKYNAATGVAINASFISLIDPPGIADTHPNTEATH
jgi:hypothetical protein